MTESNEKDLVIAALRQRIGELVSAYETEVAVIRAAYTKLKEDFDHVSRVLADQTPESLDNTSQDNPFQPVTKFTPPDVKKKKD
jgi:hypothetical protein